MASYVPPGGVAVNALEVVVGQAKWSARAVLAGPDGHPYHPMLVTVPIGAWVASMLFDIASELVSRPAILARGSELLIAVGLLGALLAGAVGGIDLVLIPAGTPAFRTACAHMLLNFTLMIAYAGNFAWRYTTGPHGAVPAGLLAFSAVSVAVLFVSGYLGGKLTYRYGVRVAVELPPLRADRLRADLDRAPAAGLLPAERRGPGFSDSLALAKGLIPGKPLACCCVRAVGRGHCSGGNHCRHVFPIRNSAAPPGRCWP